MKTIKTKIKKYLKIENWKFHIYQYKGKVKEKNKVYW